MILLQSHGLVLPSVHLVLNSGAGIRWEAPLMTVITLGHRPLKSMICMALCVAAALVVSACSDDSGDTEVDSSACAETVCTVGAAECYGNAVWTCESDGLGWSKEGCGGLMSCVAGACVDSECQIPGKSQCDDESGGRICAPDKQSEASFTCEAGEHCEEGACISDSCEADTTACGYRAVFSCVNGGWTGEKCSPGELCVSGDDGARCEPWSCEPGKARCEGGASAVCDVEGSEETVTACSADEVCEGGYCVTATCEQVAAGEAGPQSVEVSDVASDEGTPDVEGDEAEDATSADVGPVEPEPHPELEPISRIDFKLSGIPNNFGLAAQADYQGAESRMVISGSDGVRKLEINLAEVEPYTVGSWSDTDDTDVVAVVCYYDGTVNQTPPDGAGCSVGFSHASSLYSLTIDANNGDGYRVTGSFETTLIDALGGQIQFTEGTFDVLHK